MYSLKFAFTGIKRVLDAISSCINDMGIPEHESKLLTFLRGVRLRVQAGS